MKIYVKIILVILSLLCITLFSACSSKNDDGLTTSTPVSSTENISETTQASTQQDTTAPSLNEEKTTKKATPETKQELITAFNASLQKKAPSCSSSSQKLSSGKLWLGNNSEKHIDLLADDQAELRSGFEQENAGLFSLSELNDSNVASATKKGTTVTYTLSNSTAQNALEQGEDGYLAVIDTNRTQELVSSVKKYANVSGNVKISSSTYSMQNGTFVVTFNDSFSEIKSVKYLASQNVTAQMKYLIMTINADLNYNLYAEFN